MSTLSGGPRPSRGRSTGRPASSDTQDGIAKETGHTIGSQINKFENSVVALKPEQGGKDAIQPGINNYFRKRKNRDIPATLVCSTDTANGPSKNISSSDIIDGASGPATKTTEIRPTKQRKTSDRDDVNQGAELLLGFFQAKCEGSESATNEAQDSNSRNNNNREDHEAANSEAEKVSPVATRSAAGVSLDEDWAWEPSCHEGLYTFHDGRKRWYHCMYCPYFNDRLYHSKMHFERIHVKQGKSMPRKRKYMDPAGSKAGEAACLPPSTQKQPEPKYSKTRRPGDKWLKTVTDNGSHTGFRYQSVHDLKPSVSRSSSPQSHHEGEAASDDGFINSNDIQRHSLILSPAAKALHCWESSAAIQRGVERGDFGKYWKPVYTFQSEIGRSSPTGACAKDHDSEYQIDSILSSAAKRWQWWWYKPAGSGFNSDNSCSEAAGKDPHSNLAEAGSEVECAHQGWMQSAANRDSGAKVGEMETVGAVKIEGLAAEMHPCARSAASVLGNGIFVPAHSRLMNEMSFSAHASNGFNMAGSNYQVRNVGRGRGTESAGGGRAKRVWRRWDPNEENALREAVDQLGTKDWAAIHERMGTDRSIKQLQDHWNDTKKERIPAPPARS